MTTVHRILHVFRSPVGGLFRHVLDLARGQSERGNAVGLYCDSSTGGERAEAALAALAPSLALGVTRVPMHRNPHPLDALALTRLALACRTIRPDVLHGHGSKGGLFARLAPMRGAIRAYTPHGGSFNYEPGTALHHIYMVAERALARRTDVFLFESAFVERRFETYIGKPKASTRVVRNGIRDDEFEPISHEAKPFDLLFLGELREIKGIDTLIDAVARIEARDELALRLLIVGAGPDEASLRQRADAAGIAERTVFAPPQPIRAALARARIMVVPSRGESLPYVILEAAAAAQPLVSTDVGGIPEIFGPYRADLIKPNDAGALANAILRKLREPDEERRAKAQALSDHIRVEFGLDGMVEGVLTGYETAFERHQNARN